MNSSLLKYDNPVLVSKTTTSIPQKTGKQTHPQQQLNIPSGQTKLPPLEKKSSGAIPAEDILDKLLPPREWEENGERWIQKVSSAPATRLDVLSLQEQLDLLLQKRQARETGIDPIRRELYDQAFDELIRQVTVSCQERGLLLLRIRDEIKMTIASYQTLYESSIAYGMRKALIAEQSNYDIQDKIVKLTADKKQLESQVEDLKAKCDLIEKRESEKKALDDKKHADEIAFLKKTNLQLKAQLESILNPPKKP